MNATFAALCIRLLVSYTSSALLASEETQLIKLTCQTTYQDEKHIWHTVPMFMTYILVAHSLDRFLSVIACVKVPFTIKAEL